MRLQQESDTHECQTAPDGLRVMALSARSGEGMESWLEWLEARE